MSDDWPPIARVVVEGAVARFVGRPETENPNDSVHGERQHEGWRFGWAYSDQLLEHTAAEQAARWLRDAS